MYSSEDLVRPHGRGSFPQDVDAIHPQNDNGTLAHASGSFPLVFDRNAYPRDSMVTNSVTMVPGTRPLTPDPCRYDTRHPKPDTRKQLHTTSVIWYC